MKFGKLLQSSTQHLPEMGNVFLRYKELKKQLKSMAAGGSPRDKVDDAAECNDSAANLDQKGRQVPPVRASDFLRTLNEDLSRFNQFYIEKEEECVIKLHALTERARQATSEADLHLLKAELVEFHGEMVLLLHWSMLNYAAVMKILKKHDKCTGLVLKRPYQPIVLMQPFSSTSILSGLVKDAEALMLRLVAPPSTTPSAAPQPLSRGGSSAGSCDGASPARQQLQQLHVDEGIFLQQEPQQQEPRTGQQQQQQQEEQQNNQNLSDQGQLQQQQQHLLHASGTSVQLADAEHQESQPSVDRAVREGGESGTQEEVEGAASETSASDSEEAGCGDDGTAATLGMLRRRTELALQMWERMTQTASTPSTVLTPDGFSRLLPLKREHPSTQAGQQEPGCTSPGAKRQRARTEVC